MTRVELLTIEDCFQISGFGVVLLPDFSVPGGRWQDREDTVVIAKPDGQDFQATARFGLSHFNIADPKVSIDRRWRVTVSFPGRTKDELPIGSKILVSSEVREAILPSA